jgi:hypothetical protein
VKIRKRKYLPEMAAGKVIGCFGLTEPNFGSNPEGMLTKAERVRDGGVLTARRPDYEWQCGRYSSSLGEDRGRR